MKAKILGCSVTRTGHPFADGLVLDELLLQAALLAPGEPAEVTHVRTGRQFRAPVRPALPGRGEVGVDGRLARDIDCGDAIVVVAYHLAGGPALRQVPRLIEVGVANQICWES